MNKFIILGRICNDPEVRYSADGKAIVKFNFAVNRRFRREGEDEADFFQCVAFGKTAETMEKCNIGKGTKLLIDGEMRNNNYEKNGQKIYGMQVVVNSFEFCESKSSSNNSGGGYSNPTFPGSGAIGDGFMNIPDGVEDEGLPFN